MAALTIHLDAQIDSLSGLKSDLEECFRTTDAKSTHARYALDVAIAQLAHRIAALEAVVRHHGGDDVTIGDLTLDESRVLGSALQVLDGELVRDPAGREDRLWARIRLVLAAADDLLLAAARGEGEGTAGLDSGPRPGVVLPLVRSSR
jgi:hypothetical protein